MQSFQIKQDINAKFSNKQLNAIVFNKAINKFNIFKYDAKFSNKKLNAILSIKQYLDAMFSN